jgi:cytochrome c553
MFVNAGRQGCAFGFLLLTGRAGVISFWHLIPFKGGKMKTSALILLSAVLIAGLAAAAHHEPSEGIGKALFNDPKLGSTGKSCNDCHGSGKGMDKAAGREDLDSVINTCITRALKGKALDKNSVEMRSLILYINSFGTKKQGAKNPS